MHRRDNGPGRARACQQDCRHYEDDINVRFHFNTSHYRIRIKYERVSVLFRIMTLGKIAKAIKLFVAEEFAGNVLIYQRHSGRCTPVSKSE